MKLAFVRRLAVATALLFGSVVVQGAVANESKPWLSSRQIANLKVIATQRPCAAMALVYLWYPEAKSGHGAIAFDGIPSASSVSLLLDHTGGSESEGSDIVMLRSPYSEAAYYVQVQWSVTRIDARTFVFTTRAELFTAAGAALRPAHYMEPAAQILVSADSFELLNDGKTI